MRFTRAWSSPGIRSAIGRVAVVLGLLVAGGALPARAETAVPAPGLPASPLATRLSGLARSPALHPGETGIVLVRLADGLTVFEKNADRPLRPASTMKILTSAASLALLNPEYTFETTIHADAPITADGTLQGNLYIRGSGAPDLVGESWWLMARRLAASGLRAVRGDLVADESYFDAERRPPGWRSVETDSWYNAPLSALACNFNVVTVRIDPSPFLGARPDVTLEPIASYFQVMNRATTSTRPTSVEVTRLFEEGINTLVISGSVRRGGGPLVFNRAVEEPALYALHAFRDIARSEGIEVQGRLRTGTVPDGARSLQSLESKPLATIVRDMNKHSNNFVAEALLKTLGAQFAGQPGTTAGGIDVLRTYLAGIGVETAGATLVDGSGLSDRDRLPARLLATVLTHAADNFEIGPELVASLPVGGADGTLDERFGGEGARRKVRAKTGRIAGALTLAGYAVNRDDRRFAFVVFANAPRGTTDAVHRAMDQMVDAIVQSTDRDLPP